MHFLKKDELYRERTFDKPWAVATVRFEEGALIVVPGQIGVAKPDALFVPLPDRIKVLDSETLRPIKASGAFWVSTETFDPFHLVADWRESCPK